MTKEEKAKAYDEALERAKKYNIDDAHACQGTLVKLIFPQLAESEDERIRKRIKGLIYHNDSLLDKDALLAWLEKQKTSEEALEYLRQTHSPSEVSDFQAAMNIAVAKAYDKGVADTLEKQKEEEGYEAIPVKSTLEYKLGFADGRDSERQKELSELGKYIADKRSKVGFYCNHKEVSWNEIPLEDRKHDYPYYFDGDIDCYPFVVRKQKEQKPEQYDIDVLEKHITKDSISELAHTVIVRNGWEIVEKEQKPAEWSEDFDEEDIRTRFAFYTCKDDPSRLYLSNVFVEEASRNHGFGTRILIAAEKVAETIGATTISLKVEQDSPANKWYHKNGYDYVAFEDGYNWLEKNLEYMKSNKQEWNEEDYIKRRALIDTLQGETTCFTTNDFISWLKSLHPQIKQEWSEGDEECVDIIINCLEMIRRDYPMTTDNIPNEHHINKGINWLKSLRPQSHEEIYQSAKHQLAIKFMNYLDENRPEGMMSLSNGECEDIDKAFEDNDWSKIIRYVKKYHSSWKPTEWSHEDKAHMVSLLQRLDGMCKNGATFIQTRFAVSEDMDWIRSISLRQRSFWKPSKMQLTALDNVRHANGNHSLLDSLYDDLKKLM